MPAWCFGLGGRSASFGEVYGDMFDHHTVVYEYASGARVYALCRTEYNCYDNSGDIVMGSKGQCDLGSCRITGETNWHFKGPGNNPYLDEQRALIESVRNGKPINSGYHMAGSTMSTVLGQMTCYTGRPLKWDDVAIPTFQYTPGPDVASFDTPPPSKPDTDGQLPASQARLLRRSREGARRSRRNRRFAAGRIARPTASEANAMHSTFLLIALAAGVVAAPPEKSPAATKTRVLIVSQRRSLARRQENRARSSRPPWKRTRGSTPVSSRTRSSWPRRRWPTTTSSSWSSTIPSRSGTRPRSRKTSPAWCSKGRGWSSCTSPAGRCPPGPDMRTWPAESGTARTRTIPAVRSK